jgi:hypothetical protein
MILPSFETAKVNILAVVKLIDAYLPVCQYLPQKISLFPARSGD